MAQRSVEMLFAHAEAGKSTKNVMDCTSAFMTSWALGNRIGPMAYVDTMPDM